MNKPHKHAELIKAWADGAEIEVLDHDKWWSVPSPGWMENSQYRIKPEPKPDVVRYAESTSNWTGVLVQKEYHNIKLTFDGETGKLKSAEVLK